MWIEKNVLLSISLTKRKFFDCLIISNVSMIDKKLKTRISELLVRQNLFLIKVLNKIKTLTISTNVRNKKMFDDVELLNVELIFLRMSRLRKIFDCRNLAISTRNWFKTLRKTKIWLNSLWRKLKTIFVNFSSFE